MFEKATMESAAHNFTYAAARIKGDSFAATKLACVLFKEYRILYSSHHGKLQCQLAHKKT